MKYIKIKIECERPFSEEQSCEIKEGIRDVVFGVMLGVNEEVQLKLPDEDPVTLLPGKDW